MRYAPMLTKQEFERYVPNKVLHGDDKITPRQWEYLKTVVSAYMDKDTPTSPLGGVIESEVDELGSLLKQEKHYNFTDSQIDKVKAALREHIK
jgi:hypothetical protein